MRTRHNVMLCTYIAYLFYIPVFHLLFMKVYYEQVVPVYGFFPLCLYVVRFVMFCLKEFFRSHIFCYFFPRRRRSGRDDSNSAASSAKG